MTNTHARVHVSGHAYAGELLYLYNAVRPRNVMPVHGTWRHLRANAGLAAKTGVEEGRIVLAENGVSVDLHNERARISGRVPVGKMFVHGLVDGDVSDATVGERLVLGNGGFVAVTVVVRSNGRPVGRPQLFSRGFSDDAKALDPVTELVIAELNSLAEQSVNDTGRIAQSVRRVVGKWVGETYRRQPMIVPTVLTVD